MADIDENTKPALASKSFLGGVFAILSGVLVVLGGEQLEAELVDVTIAGIGSVIAGALAIWGRFTASKKIKL